MNLNLADNLIEDSWQLHQQLAERLSNSVSELLGLDTTMSCAIVERIDGCDFLDENVEIVLCQIGLPPIQGELILAIPRRLSFWIVSQLLNYSDVEEIGNRDLTKVEQISLMQFVNLIVVNLSEEWQQINSEIHARFDTLDVMGDELASRLQTCEVMLVGIETIVSQNIIENLWLCYTEDFVLTIQTEQERKREELDRQSRLRGDVRQDLVSTLEIVLESYTTRIESRLDKLEAKLDRVIQDG